MIYMETDQKKCIDAVIEVIEDGPLKISGHIVLKDLKRDVTVTLEEVSLCLCGRSKNKPFCDDSHIVKTKYEQ